MVKLSKVLVWIGTKRKEIIAVKAAILSIEIAGLQLFGGRFAS